MSLMFNKNFLFCFFLRKITIVTIIRFIYPLNKLSSGSLCDVLSRDDVLGTNVIALFEDREKCCVMVRINITNVGHLQTMSSRFLVTSNKFTQSITELLKHELSGYEIEVTLIITNLDIIYFKPILYLI